MVIIKVLTFFFPFVPIFLGNRFFIKNDIGGLNSLSPFYF